ncbi:LLM class flavin-dependent oxidoreductase [Mycolicibacterium poriferae]|uniref:LLM class flavin-dependent oxidoreductase n=1 Tax=Mycolicibacterium poriferae TaxID=39694 RepID=UPI003219CA75
MRKQLGRRLGGFRAFSYGSLYPALRRLLRAGSIAETTDEAGDQYGRAPGRLRRGRRVYRIPPAGQDRFAAMLAEAGPQAWEDGSFDVHLAFFARTPAETRIRILEGRRRAVEERRDGLRTALGRPCEGVDRYTRELHRLGLDESVLWSALRCAGVRVPLPRDLMRENYILKATPAAVTEPKLWLLGSSMYSAHLAAAKGLPYVFAHHFSGQGTEEALQTYRDEFRPGDLAAEPVTFLTVNAAVADTAAEAERLLLPNLQMMARLRTGQPLGPLDLVEDAEARQLSPRELTVVDAGRRQAVVGSPAEAADQLRALAERFGVDEVMVNPVAAAFRGTDPDTAPARETTLELLAKELF